jgi:hypothetical protein
MTQEHEKKSKIKIEQRYSKPLGGNKFLSHSSTLLEQQSNGKKSLNKLNCNNTCHLLFSPPPVPVSSHSVKIKTKFFEKDQISSKATFSGCDLSGI